MANDINLKKVLSDQEFSIAMAAMMDVNNFLVAQLDDNSAIYKAVFEKMYKGENLTTEDVRQLVAGMKILSGMMKEALKRDPKAEKINKGVYTSKQVADKIKQMDKMCKKLEKKFL